MLLLPSIVDRVFYLKPELQDKFFRIIAHILTNADYKLDFWKNRSYSFYSSPAVSAKLLQTLKSVWEKLFYWMIILQEQSSDSFLSLHVVIAKLSGLLVVRGYLEPFVDLHSYCKFLFFSFAAVESNGFASEDHHLLEDMEGSFCMQNHWNRNPDVELHRDAGFTASICDLVINERLIGMPLTGLSRLTRKLEDLLITEYEGLAIELLDNLFLQFLCQDPRETDPIYLVTRQHQVDSLRCLFEFASKHQYRRASLAELYDRWMKMIDEMLVKKKTEVGSDEISSSAKKNVVDLMEKVDLRDVTWILDDLEPNPRLYDPYDIQDVLWIYEEDDGLDLKQLRRILQESGLPMKIEASD